MSEPENWRFLAELLRQLDAGESPSTTTVANSLAIEAAQAELLMQQLRRRGLIKINEAAPKRLGDGLRHLQLLITPEGAAAAASRNIPG